MMKKILLYSLLCLPALNGVVKAAGGPDAYGYTWMDSNDPGGPAAQFIDISAYGTLVTGLGDDNSSASFINVGFPFHFYWVDYNQVKIGSNGWVSFSNVSNIASCFPTIPTAGGADAYLAALMSDLNFTGAGNPGQVYTYTNSADTCIIMFKTVPYWYVNAPGYVGANSFEIILCGADSSITFQYGALSNFTNNAACVDMTVGIENSTGNIGLQVYNDAIPPSNYAICFKYPQTVLLAVDDVTPRWNMNTDNGALFKDISTFSLVTNVKNVGNTNLSTSTSVTAVIKDITNTSIFSTTDVLNSMPVGFDTTLTHPVSVNISTPGQYAYQTTVVNSQDINSGNNTLTTELEVVDVCSGAFTMSYVTGNTPSGSLNWNGGANDDGAAVYFIPPAYPINISNVQVYVSSNVANGFLVKIYADDGPNNTPGTLLYNGSLAAASVISGAWNVISVPSIAINSGGFYVAFFQTGTNIFMGTETTSPLSNRNYEILDGVWAAYRDNSTRDICIRANVTYPYNTGPGMAGPITGITDFCAGAEDTLTYSIPVLSGATDYAWQLPAGWTGSSTTHILQAIAGPSGGTISVTASNHCGSALVDTVINVQPLPNLVLSSTDSVLCYGEFSTVSFAGADVYTWNGVPHGTPFNFYPAVSTYGAVIGTDTTTGCSSLPDTLFFQVHPLPLISLSMAGNDTLCINNGSVALNGIPMGGTYSGSGISGTNFDPSVAGTGTHLVVYQLTDGNGCSNTDSLSLTVLPCLGMENENAGSLSVYPNPFTSYITVNGLQAGDQVQLYTVWGQVVSTGIANGTSYTFADLTQSMYILQVISDGKVSSRKLIKE